MAIVNPSSSSIYPIDKRMNAYDIEIEYDEENDNYYAEHEFAYPSKRVRLNIDTENSLWPTDENNEMTITIPSNPQTDANNTWDDTTKTLTLTNLDQNTLITNNQNPTYNYATELNINLLNYQQSTNNPNSISIIKLFNGTTGTYYTIADNNTNNYWNFYSNNNITINDAIGKEILTIQKDNQNNTYILRTYSNYSQSTINISAYNMWIYSNNTSPSVSDVYMYNSNNQVLFWFGDDVIDTNSVLFKMNTNVFNFNGINWMTFN